MSDPAVDHREARDLPFLWLVVQGFGSLLRNFIPFLKMAAIPVLLYLVGWKAVIALSTPDLAGPLVLVLDSAAMTLFGMAWLGCLLAPNSERKYWLPQWRREHWLFLLYSLLISGLDLMVGEAVQLIGIDWQNIEQRLVLSLLTPIATLPVDYVHASLGLTFCALAISRAGSPLWSWRLLGWSALKMTLAIWGVSFCFSVAGGSAIGFLLVLLSQSGDFPLILSLLLTVIDYARYALILGIFAAAYRKLTGWTPAQESLADRFD